MNASRALPRDTPVAVIGAGAMGTGIAQIAAQAGHPVRLFDTRMGVAEKACASIRQTLQTLAAKGKLDAPEATAAGERIVAVHALGDCVSVSLVIEAIVEALGEKRSLLRELEKIVTPSAILASNTSSLSITALAAGLRYPARVVGMHFFNPVPLMKLVEIVSGLATDPQVADTVAATAVSWGKDAVRATSTPGFIVNRCARPFYGEALRLLEEGACDAPTIDALLREAGGFRMGAFELIDLIGSDVNLAVTRSVWDACYHDPRYAPSVLQEERVVAGYLGRKSGRGFYAYGEGAAPPVVATLEPKRPPQRVTVHGDLGPAMPLVDRLVRVGIAIEKTQALAAFPDGALSIANAVLALSDGRTATVRAQAAGVSDLVLFDLALDYRTCKRIALASADRCSNEAFDRAAGLMQAVDIAVSRVDDVAALVVLRTIATLANEAADAVTHRIASAQDVDVAMQKGVNYPRGPLRWADDIGLTRTRDVLQHLAAHYGEDRYRISPLITRRCAAGVALSAGPT